MHVTITGWDLGVRVLDRLECSELKLEGGGFSASVYGKEIYLHAGG